MRGGGWGRRGACGNPAIRWFGRGRGANANRRRGVASRRAAALPSCAWARGLAAEAPAVPSRSGEGDDARRVQHLVGLVQVAVERLGNVTRIKAKRIRVAVKEQVTEAPCDACQLKASEMHKQYCAR